MATSGAIDADDADLGTSTHVRFSNRPFEVKHFRTISHCSVDVASRARASLRYRH